MLVINFSYNKEDFEVFKKNAGSATYHTLDISGVLTEASGATKASQLDSGFNLLKEAVADMADTLGTVSLLALNEKEQLRDLEVNGLNLFWQTSISEKHPARNFLANLFYLKKILSAKLLSHSFQSAHIILPSHQEAVYNGAIKKYFSNSQSVNEVTFNHQFNITAFAGYRSFIYKVQDHLKESLSLKSRIGKVNKTKGYKTYANYIVTTVPGTWQEPVKEDRVLGKIPHFSSTPDSTYLPYVISHNQDFTWSEAWDKSYVNYFPGKLQLRLHQLKSVLAYRKTQQFASLDFTGIDFIDDKVLRSEFQKVLFDQNYVFINYLWMKNFFSSLKQKAQVFYQDEFYPTGGRFITQAINRSGRSNITSCGLQHGIIYDGHSVYYLTAKELSSTKPFNGLPKPDKFIVWGPYFKDLLNRHNVFKDNELLVAGNPNYLVVNEKYKHLKNKNEVPVILWCTSVDYLARQQYDLLHPFLSTLRDYRLVIRFHPLLNIKDQLLQIMNEDVLQKTVFNSSDDIFEALFKADLILAITASTIFMDALVLNKMVYQFKIDGYYNAALPSDNTQLITASSDLTKAYQDFSEGAPKNLLAQQQLLYMDSAVWTGILKEKNT